MWVKRSVICFCVLDNLWGLGQVICLWIEYSKFANGKNLFGRWQRKNICCCTKGCAETKSDKDHGAIEAWKKVNTSPGSSLPAESRPPTVTMGPHWPLRNPAPGHRVWPFTDQQTIPCPVRRLQGSFSPMWLKCTWCVFFLIRKKVKF